jgi:hypothetical protein
MSNQELQTDQPEKRHNRGRKFVRRATALGAVVVATGAAVVGTAGLAIEMNRGPSSENKFSDTIERALKVPMRYVGGDLEVLDTSAEGLTGKQAGEPGALKLRIIAHPNFNNVDLAMQQGAEQLPNPWEVATYKNRAEVMTLTGVLNGVFGDNSPYSSEKADKVWRALRSNLAYADQLFQEGHGYNTKAASPRNNHTWRETLDVANDYYSAAADIAVHVLDDAQRDNPNRPLVVPVGVVEETA